jgi:hypothetical protein
MRDSSVSYASAAAKVDAWIFSVAISPINILRNLILFKFAVTFNFNRMEEPTNVGTGFPVYMFIAKNGYHSANLFPQIFCSTWCIELKMLF